jgi:membrane-bound serine protease (ClpP class)
MIATLDNLGHALAALSWNGDVGTLAAVLLVAGIVLVGGEIVLPTHGVLGFFGLLCFAGLIGICFYINRWLGLAVFAVAVLSSPLLVHVSMRLWARSPIGRRVILPPANVAPAPAPVRVGTVGVAVTELRPVGECEFGQHRLEAASELGMIRVGEPVEVIAVENGRPTVRRVRAPATV